MDTTDKVYRDMLKKYGIDNQMIVAIEEMSELSQILSKRLRYNNLAKTKTGCISSMYSLTNMVEEIADVEIMMEQLKLYYNLYDKVNKWKRIKRIRMRKRYLE